MKQVRIGVFETNSSSVHSLSIAPKEKYDLFVKGELLFDTYNNIFVTKKEASIMETDGKYHDIESYEDYNSMSQNYETFSQTYITEKGDEIVVFGYYGENR